MINNNLIKKKIKRQGDDSISIVNFVMVAQRADKINYRVKKLFSIRHQNMKNVLVTRANRFEVSNNHIFIKPFPNPLGLLRLMGLEKEKNWLEKYLYFPSGNILYTKAAYHKLKTVIADQLKLDNKVNLITCCPPYDLSILGLKLKKKCRKSIG